MSRRTPLLLAVLLAAALAPAGASAAGPADRYIVVLKDGAGQPGAVAREHARSHGASVRFVYRDALEGYAATIPPSRVAAVRGDARVDYVEEDGTVQVAKPPWQDGGGSGDTSTTSCKQVLPWGIDRIDADVSSTKAGDCAGAITNVNAYVIDTGIDTKHADLNVVAHQNFAGGRNTDCHGHGTHVAGTVAARDNSGDVVGAAPGAPLTGVKVLGCGGTGSTSGVIKGVDWVTANAKKPATANMSLGGGASTALDDAVRNSADSGVFYSIAAGNDGADACNYSPARAGTHNGVTTTAATDKGDKETSWSNYGPCVDVWAPGASILSTKKGGGTTTMSGTSMAAPHVGGTGALYLSSNTAASAGAVEDAVKAAAQATATTSKDGRAITLDYAGGF